MLCCHLQALHRVYHGLPAEVEEALDEVPVNEALSRLCLHICVEAAPERVVDLAHALDGMCEALLQLVQELVQVLWYLRHQTCAHYSDIL